MQNRVENYLNEKINNALGTENDNIGIGGFNFFAMLESRLEEPVDYPDIPLASGSVVSDHMIKNPLTIEVDGFLSAIRWSPTALDKLFQKSAEVISDVNVYANDYTASQLQSVVSLQNNVSNAISGIDELIRSGEQIYDVFFPESKFDGVQREFIDFIFTTKNSGQLIDLEMPNFIVSNMAITNFRPTFLAENGRDYGFRLSLKQLTFTDIYSEEVSQYKKNPPDQIKNQTDSPKDSGVIETKTVPVSAASRIFGGS